MPLSLKQRFLAVLASSIVSYRCFGLPRQEARPILKNRLNFLPSFNPFSLDFLRRRNIVNYLDLAGLRDCLWLLCMRHCLGCIGLRGDFFLVGSLGLLLKKWMYAFKSKMGKGERKEKLIGAKIFMSQKWMVVMGLKNFLDGCCGVRKYLEC